jgi:hypothetical protein
MVIAFEQAGANELVERIDAPRLDTPGAFNGADLAHVRGARRALKRGNLAAAKGFATRVADAWTVADEIPPSVAEMQKILAMH